MKCRCLLNLSGCILVCLLAASLGASRVVEFGEEFLQREQSKPFLIKFYAPWCGHCRNMEAAYSSVSDLLASSGVTVGRIDATAHQLVASHFHVRGFPTLIYIKGTDRFEYRGERSAEEIVKFVLRVSGDTVKLVASPGRFQEVYQTSDSDPFFLFIGSEKSDEFAVYNYIASQMRADSTFYRADADLLGRLPFDLADKRFDRDGPPVAEPAVLVFKDGGCLLFPGKFDNDSLGVWMTNEKYLLYPKVGDFLFYSFYPTTKLLVVLIGNDSDKSGASEQFVQLGRQLAFSADPLLHNVQFAWTGASKAASDLAMTGLPAPNFISMNPNSSQYYLRREYHRPAAGETLESLKQLTLMALGGELPAYGGGGVVEGIKRSVYDFATGLAGFVIGHPGLALVVIGAPVGVIGVLCYAICCMDTDGDEPELPEEYDEDEEVGDDAAVSAGDAGEPQALEEKKEN